MPLLPSLPWQNQSLSMWKEGELYESSSEVFKEILSNEKNNAVDMKHLFILTADQWMWMWMRETDLE
jgi:hypothetical protein